jgi:DnaJ-class molecular chaperone
MALSRIVNELDYYQLMHVPRSANRNDVKLAYHATSRVFHPDVNRHLDDDLRNAVSKISKRVCEAYTVLRNPRRREAYDRQLEQGGGVRQKLVQPGDTNSAQANDAARTPQGRQYWKLAQADLGRGDQAAAARNLQTALTFEPDNKAIRAALDAAKQAR